MRNYIIFAYMITITCVMGMNQTILRDVVSPFVADSSHKTYDLRPVSTRKNDGNVLPEELLLLPCTINPCWIPPCFNMAHLYGMCTKSCGGYGRAVVNPQLKTYPDRFVLVNQQRSTRDMFIPSQQEIGSPVWDGINKKNTGLVVYHYDIFDGSLGTNTHYYTIYMLLQSHKKNTNKKYHNYTPLFMGRGTVKALLLHQKEDRIIYSVDTSDDTLPHTLLIKDIIRNSDTSLSDSSHKIATLRTSLLFTKMVHLGKDTYFGITNQGCLYSVWLNEYHGIEYAQQHFPQEGQCLIDMAVDNTVSTESGFKQKIAFLTKSGNIYITHLDAFTQYTLFKIVVDALDIHTYNHLFYNGGTLFITYQNDSMVVTVHDNFEWLYYVALLKRTYKEFYI